MEALICSVNMTSPEEILPGVIFYAYRSAKPKEKVCIWNHHTLILQVSGDLVMETSDQRTSINGGQMLLIHKDQLGTLRKTPEPESYYETIVISLQEELLRKIALEDRIQADHKYAGLPNLIIPNNDYLQGYFRSLCPQRRRGRDRRYGHPESKRMRKVAVDDPAGITELSVRLFGAP